MSNVENTEMTFEDAIDKFRTTLIHGGYMTPPYLEAINTISILWDYKRAREINEAIAPSWERPLMEEPDHVYILMSVRSNTYCILSRNQRARWI